MLVSVNVGMLAEKDAKASLGAKVFNAVTKHPWYSKYVNPIAPDVVFFQILEDDGFTRVQCGSDGRRMLKFNISKKLGTIAGVHLFKSTTPGTWKYVSSYLED